MPAAIRCVPIGAAVGRRRGSMSIALERLRDALTAHGCKPNDRGQAHCPAHEDGRASLSFAEGSDGVVLKCHAGCTTAAVVEALSLTMADLFDKAPGPRREVATYDYLDEAGKLLFQVVRFDPKDFRQRRPDER